MKWIIDRDLQCYYYCDDDDGYDGVDYVCVYDACVVFIARDIYYAVAPTIRLKTLEQWRKLKQATDEKKTCEIL